MQLAIRPRAACRWDLVVLGEVMLRLDPGEGRIHTSRHFRAWEGGAEYNVARGLRRAFGMNTTVVTALVDNPIGRLVEDLMLQGGVDQSHVRWVPYDGVGRSVRNGLNFTERGFGIRGAVGYSDRGNTAVSQLTVGEIDWDAIFTREGARWFHTGGVLAALSQTSGDVAREAMAAARASGTLVSYDLNWRESLWQAQGGRLAAQRLNRDLARYAHVLIGNEEDFSAALGFPSQGHDGQLDTADPADYERLFQAVATSLPNLQLIAATLRRVHTAGRNDWSAVCWVDGSLHTSRPWKSLDILDRVGAGDSFSAGLIYALLQGKPPSEAMEYGAAHGALAMTTPGDNSMASLAEVERVIAGDSPRITR